MDNILCREIIDSAMSGKSATLMDLEGSDKGNVWMILSS